MSGELILVDGYNVIRRSQPLRDIETRQGLEAGREALLLRLQSSAAARGRRLLVVFDGAEGAPSAGTPPTAPLAVRFSRPPQSADDAILSLVRESSAPRTITVVTADRELGSRARQLGAQVMEPEPWLSRMEARRRRIAAPMVDEAGKPRATSSEIEWGLSVFGDETVEVAPRPKRRRPGGAPVENPQEADLKARRKARHLRRTRRS